VSDATRKISRWWAGTAGAFPSNVRRIHLLKHQQGAIENRLALVQQLVLAEMTVERHHGTSHRRKKYLERTAVGAGLRSVLRISSNGVSVRDVACDSTSRARFSTDSAAPPGRRGRRVRRFRRPRVARLSNPAQRRRDSPDSLTQGLGVGLARPTLGRALTAAKRCEPGSRLVCRMVRRDGASRLQNEHRWLWRPHGRAPPPRPRSKTCR
jgi:hypothetical protein